jgi:hypothetical protein
MITGIIGIYGYSRYNYPRGLLGIKTFKKRGRKYNVDFEICMGIFYPRIPVNADYTRTFARISQKSAIFGRKKPPLSGKKQRFVVFAEKRENSDNFAGGNQYKFSLETSRNCSRNYSQSDGTAATSELTNGLTIQNRSGSTDRRTQHNQERCAQIIVKSKDRRAAAQSVGACQCERIPATGADAAHVAHRTHRSYQGLSSQSKAKEAGQAKASKGLGVILWSRDMEVRQVRKLPDYGYSVRSLATPSGKGAQ